MPRNNRHRQNGTATAAATTTGTTTRTATTTGINPNRRFTAESSSENTQQPPQSSSLKPNPKLLSLLLQALIMTFVISLFFIFIGVAAIIFLHLCIAGGALHRRRNRRRPIRSDVESPSGLSPDSLKSLPVSRLNQSEFCAICLDNIEIGDFSRVLPDCDHVFHVDCVDKWLAKVPGCPTCRSSVRVSGRELDCRDGINWERLWAAYG